VQGGVRAVRVLFELLGFLLRATLKRACDYRIVVLNPREVISRPEPYGSLQASLTGRHGCLLRSRR
jgi:hypothetical protein